jgi:Type II secretion system (T2SS), protein E, N-terminal domain
MSSSTDKAAHQWSNRPAHLRGAEGYIPSSWEGSLGDQTDAPQSLQPATRAVHGLKRIGEILVDARAITEKTRDNTLAFSKANGVTFGTAILETGALSEELLLRALSVQTSSPPASARDLAFIPPGVIRLVPGKLAEKYSVIPFRKVGRTLYLAMIRPWDHRAAAEIEFLTGLTVIRHVAVMARLVVALEKHYGILASPRHKTLAAKLGESTEAASPATNTASEPLADRLHALTAASSLSRVPLAEDPLDPWTVLSEPAEATEEDELALEMVEPGLSPSDVQEALYLVRETPAPDAAPTPTAEAGPAGLLDQLGRAEGRDEIGSAILDSMKASLRTAALFAVDGERVSGWMARPEPPKPLRELSLGFSEPSVFSSLRNTVGFFAGLCPDTVADRRILESLGVRFPAVIGVVPVTTYGNTVLYLLGQAIEGEDVLTIPLIKKHAAMTAIALEILALRTRLRETEAASPFFQ